MKGHPSSMFFVVEPLSYPVSHPEYRHFEEKVRGSTKIKIS